jgi:hypothetical protein
LNGQTPFTFFFMEGGQIIDNWCTTSGCTWDDPTGDGRAPAAAPGSPLNVVAAANGLIAYFLTLDGHIISLNTSQGFSDTWQDITAATGAPAAASESPLTTVVTADATAVTHFIVPGGHIYSISCGASGCTWRDETAAANAVTTGFF